MTDKTTVEDALTQARRRAREMTDVDTIEQKFLIAATSSNPEDVKEAERLLSLMERKAALNLEVIR